MVDVARRLCEDNHVQVNEIWSYHTVADQVRFTLVHRSRELPPPAKTAKPKAAAPRKVTSKPAAPKAAKKPAAKAKPKPKAKSKPKKK